jgi:hypothetical protein
MIEYFVTHITKLGWQRITPNYQDVIEAQKIHSILKRKYPNACVVVDDNHCVKRRYNRLK